MKPIYLCCGYDPRERVGFHVFEHSVLERTSAPVCFFPMAQLGVDSGSNAFTLSRFLVPALMQFKGHAIFVDGCDMLCMDDIAKLDALFDPEYALQVVQHPAYQTKHQIKYVGTSMQCPNTNYERKNWASVMLINCAHPEWAWCTPDAVSRSTPMHLLQLSAFSKVGSLPARWNCLVDEGQDDSDAAILHWTAGVPGIREYSDGPRALDWHAARASMNADIA